MKTLSILFSEPNVLSVLPDYPQEANFDIDCNLTQQDQCEKKSEFRGARWMCRWEVVILKLAKEEEPKAPITLEQAHKIVYQMEEINNYNQAIDYVINLLEIKVEFGHLETLWRFTKEEIEKLKKSWNVYFTFW